MTGPENAVNGDSPNHIKVSQSPPFPRVLIDQHAVNHDDGLPNKRRKIAGSKKEDPNPWNLPKVEGPTTFLKDGRRKSGRTNAVPLELQPQKAKRQTRAAYDKEVEERTKPVKSPGVGRRDGNNVHHVNVVSAEKPARRGPGRPPKSSYITNESPVKIENTPTKRVPDSPLQLRRQQASSRGKQAPKHRTAGGRGGRLSSMSNRSQAKAAQMNGHVASESSDEDESDSDSLPSVPTRPTTLQKIRFRVRLPKPSIQSPANIPLPKKFNSFREWLDKDDTEPIAGQDSLSSEQIKREAHTRQKVREAERRGKALNTKLRDAMPEEHQVPQQYTHRDHLVVHVKYFRKLMAQERSKHERMAKLLAHEAVRYLDSKRDKIEINPFELTYRNVVKDLEKLWSAVQEEVDGQRAKQWFEEQEAQAEKRKRKVLDRNVEMLRAQLRQDESRDETEELGSESDHERSSDDDSGLEDSENMSEDTSEDESESDVGITEDKQEANMTQEQLLQKYGGVSERASDHQNEHEESNVQTDTPITGGHSAHSETEESESDESTEMDSEFDTGSAEDEEANEDSASDGDAAGSSLFGLFSKKQIAEMTTEDDPDNVGDGNGDGDVTMQEEADVPEDLMTTSEIPAESGRDSHPINEELPVGDNDVQCLTKPDAQDTPYDGTSRGVSTQASPQTSASKGVDLESTSSVEPPSETHAASLATEAKSSVKTPVPSLLRATLRPYQLEGLDWLAQLYATGRSGILADEMGLGKTIQSIALLAHLATEHEQWGPHLIVVPTSVILNWEVEFKKFCPGFKVLTYYGNQDERKQKRKGWMQENAFNVCITSYQLVLQDVNSFKRRRWHYMILDEAHNIKNFRSDRWQTMMTFNTHSRLLLTGTPLQNNLTELWSLLFFLRSGQGEDVAGLADFSEWFKKPTNTILEHGRDVMNEEERRQVEELHTVIRPFLLRRLKKDVEKQMPLKYEHIELCRLSKRQRQLYDGFMSLTKTKETLASGNYMSIINALMQLRKVCNHPNLFETRPISTSFAMSKSVAAHFEIQDLLVRRRLLRGQDEQLDLDFLQLAPIYREDMSATEYMESIKLQAFPRLRALRNSQSLRITPDTNCGTQDMRGLRSSLDATGRISRLIELDRTLYFESSRHCTRPKYGARLLQKIFFGTTYEKLSRLSGQRQMTSVWETEQPTESLQLVQSVESRSERMAPLIRRYACVTPAVVATDLSVTTLSEPGVTAARQAVPMATPDPFHEARMKLSIAFPDKRLLQYDCGKLQSLDRLLRRLQSGGHRALIFTQMTKVLDILEQFLNIHGHRYLRLDGATKIDDRQMLTERFNNDDRILAFILSSRSGGLGINLTGADTVIFYDLDWNPAMDKQCTDRAHRIGQTRDVHIYRFVSEHTIESNILRKATQKQQLDDVLIQEGDFTTDFLHKTSYKDMLGDDDDDVAGLAMNRVLGGNDRTAAEVLEKGEREEEDVAAARVAAKEVQLVDEGDFEDNPVGTTTHGGENSGVESATQADIDDTSSPGDLDDYLVRMKTWLMKDIPLGAPHDRSKKKKKKSKVGDEHRIRRPR